MIVTCETIRCWCDKFDKNFAYRGKAARRGPGSTRHFDEMFITLHGEPHLLWRAVGRAQRRTQHSACSYPAAKADIPELASVKHVLIKAAARLNNRSQNSHQPTPKRAAHPPVGLLSRRVRLSRPETHIETSLVLRADQVTLRTEATSALLSIRHGK